MAIIKTIQIHDSSGVYSAERYIENLEKTTISQDLINALEYDTNADKTSMPGRRLVSGHHCTPYFAAQQFRWTRDKYYDLHLQTNYNSGKKPVEAIHLVMSFPDSVKDPELVHQIGLEFVEKLNATGLGEFQAVVSTHMNTIHLHNHILINAYSMDGRSKLHDNMTTRQLMRQLSDEISREHGLPVLDPDVPLKKELQITSRADRMKERQSRLNERRYKEKGRNYIYWKDEIRNTIDEFADSSFTYEEWKQQLERFGYTLRETNDGIPISIGYENHHCRLSKLGDGYTYRDICKKIADCAQVSPEEIRATPPRVPHVYMERVYRYDKNGRRRGKLEMLILKVLTYLKNMAKYLIQQGLMRELEQVKRQAESLQKTLDLMGEYGITTKTDLNSLEKHCGRNIKLLKEKLNITETTIQNIQKHIAEGTLPASMAEIDPMTPTQKKTLYQAFEKSSYRCYRKYNTISSTEADQIIAFLTDESSESGTVPDFMAKGYIPPSPTTEMLTAASQRAEANLQSLQKELEEQKHLYKDYKFIEKALQDADDLYAEALIRQKKNDLPETQEAVDEPEIIEEYPIEDALSIIANAVIDHNNIVNKQPEHPQHKREGMDI